MRGRLVVLGGGLIVLAVAGGALGLGGRNEAAPAADEPAATVQVVRGPLISATSVDGRLDHGPETPVAVKATGTVTWLPPEGTVVDRGQALLRVDDRPVVLLFGDLPMYRDLAEPPPPKEGEPSPTPLHGKDVQQFEANLRALGQTGFTVDQTFNAQTTAAVKRWQKTLGVPQTGSVGAGDVYYAPGPVRVAKPLVRLGAAVSGDVLSTTGTTRQVTVKAPAGDAAWAATGAEVSVLLPDQRSVPGKVSKVVPEQQPEGQATGAGAQPAVLVVIEIADQNALGTLDRSPVTVRHVTAKKDDVLSVPVSALVALAEGGYGLEVDDGGSSHFVAVTTGLFAEGRVEVSGTGVEAGTSVRMPR